MVHILHGAAAKNVGSVIMAYGQDLFEGVTGIFTTSIASLASTMIIIQLVFINETLLGNSKAKLFFAFGYFLALVIFYTTALICFPVGGGGKGEGDGVEEGEGMEMEGGGEDESEGGMVGSLGNLLSSKTRQQMLDSLPAADDRVVLLLFAWISVWILGEPEPGEENRKCDGQYLFLPGTLIHLLPLHGVYSEELQLAVRLDLHKHRRHLWHGLVTNRGRKNHGVRGDRARR